jgi:hypothetical protein
MDRNIKNQKQNGQSLVEAMVAITALTVSFIGISALLARSLSLDRTTTDELTATYLASEGVEIAKNLIDHDVYAYQAGRGVGWGACFENGGNFELDYTTTDCSALVTFAGDPLYYHADTHLYDYDKNGGAPTDFTRDIVVKNINISQPYDEIQVDSIVNWSSFGNEQSVDLQDDFYYWNADPAP